MIDPTGRIVSELRAAAADWPSPLTDYRVDPGELAPESVRADGKAPLAIVVRPPSPLRARRLPIARYVFTIDCYHPDMRIATQLAGLVSDTYHDRGPRTASTADQGVVGIYASAHSGGSGAILEPGTNWPVARLTVTVIGSTLPIT